MNVKRSLKNDKRSYTDALSLATEDSSLRKNSRNLYTIKKEVTGKGHQKTQ